MTSQKCKSKSGELCIHKYLSAQNTPFKTQQLQEDCKSNIETRVPSQYRTYPCCPQFCTCQVQICHQKQHEFGHRETFEPNIMSRGFELAGLLPMGTSSPSCAITESGHQIDSCPFSQARTWGAQVAEPGPDPPGHYEVAVGQRCGGNGAELRHPAGSDVDRRLCAALPDHGAAHCQIQHLQELRPTRCKDQPGEQDKLCSVSVKLRCARASSQSQDLYAWHALPQARRVHRLCSDSRMPSMLQNVRGLLFGGGSKQIVNPTQCP